MGPQSKGHAQQQLLNLPQEAELVAYIEDLSAKSLPPTRKMICNFALEITGLPVGVSWVLRFLHRYHNQFSLKWSAAIDSNCHAADSYRNILYTLISSTAVMG
jgi:hypothetical protein